MGLNRRLDNLSNTLAAATLAQEKMKNIYSLELGNEPTCALAFKPIRANLTNAVYTDSDPIARGKSWTASADYASQIYWQDAVCGNLSATNLISAGVYFGTSPMNIDGLTSHEGSANIYVKDYCSHNYPQSASTVNLAKLMGHSDIAKQITPFASEYAAAAAMGKPYIFGETNSGSSLPVPVLSVVTDTSATGGGGGISPTFGAGLWILDYVMQTVLMGVEVSLPIHPFIHPPPKLTHNPSTRPDTLLPPRHNRKL